MNGRILICENYFATQGHSSSCQCPLRSLNRREVRAFRTRHDVHILSVILSSLFSFSSYLPTLTLIPPLLYASKTKRKLAPIAWPTAKLLDYILGASEEHTYKKAELKSFLQFHRTGEEPLRDDEISILNGVLELNTKNVEEIMTPMKVRFVVCVFVFPPANRVGLGG